MGVGGPGELLCSLALFCNFGREKRDRGMASTGIAASRVGDEAKSLVHDGDLEVKCILLLERNRNFFPDYVHSFSFCKFGVPKL